MKLCRELGGMTLEQMLSNMSSSEYSTWKAFFVLEEEEQKKRR